MVLPLVPLAIIAMSGATGLGGAVAGAVGGAQIRNARRLMHADLARYDLRYAAHVLAVDDAGAALHSFGRAQHRAQQDVIYRMRDFLTAHAKQVKTHEHLILEGIDDQTHPVTGLARLDPEVAGWVRGVVGASVAGFATQAGIRTAVVRLATASTGTAIASLSGAAAESATLAFLGGGSLAVGGGGVALGATMLNVATAGPAVLVAGLAVKNRGAKARTEAERFRTGIDLASAELDGRDEQLRAIRRRAAEMDEILLGLEAQAAAALDLLESEPFDIDAHAELLQTALILVKSVRDVAVAPIVTEDGNLSDTVEDLIFTYRNKPRGDTDDVGEGRGQEVAADGAAH